MEVEKSAQMHSSTSGGASSQHKRSRASSDAYDQQPPISQENKPLKSTAEMMALAGMPQEVLDTLNVTCGVREVAQMTEAVRTCLRDTLQKYSGVVPVRVLRQCCLKEVDLIDITMLQDTQGMHTARLCRNL